MTRPALVLTATLEPSRPAWTDPEATVDPRRQWIAIPAGSTSLLAVRACGLLEPPVPFQVSPEELLVALAPDAGALATVSDCALGVTGREGEPRARRPMDPGWGRPRRLSFTPSGRHLLLVGEARSGPLVTLFEASTLDLAGTLRTPGDASGGMAVHFPAGEGLALFETLAGPGLGTVCVLRWSEGRFWVEDEGRDLGNVYLAGFTPDGEHVLGVSLDAPGVRKWRLPDLAAVAGADMAEGLTCDHGAELWGESLAVLTEDPAGWWAMRLFGTGDLAPAGRVTLPFDHPTVPLPGRLLLGAEPEGPPIRSPEEPRPGRIHLKLWALTSAA